MEAFWKQAEAFPASGRNLSIRHGLVAEVNLLEELGGGSMPIEHIHSYMVHPRKGAIDERDIGGATLPHSGKLFELLNSIYSDDECDIDISFNPAADGSKQNDCRDLVVNYLQGPTIIRGRQIASRLEKVTDHRSGQGLLFLIAGTEGHEHKLVISRFPADSAILAEEDQKNLSIEFLERVFMKSATAYKAAKYQDASLTSGFWLGQATDRQINARVAQISEYWISNFLNSDFRTTAAAGTRRLAIALRQAVKKSDDVVVKSEIAAAVTLTRALAGQRLSISDFETHFGLSKAARQAIRNELKSDEQAAERFKLDWQEFNDQVAFRSLELDNGGLITADSEKFEKVFRRENLDSKGERVRIISEGRIVGESLGKTR